MGHLENKVHLILLLMILPIHVSTMSTIVINGTLDKNYTNQVNSSIQILYQFSINSSYLLPEEDPRNALRAYSFSDNSKMEDPVTIVVNQRRGVLSWELPMMVGSEEYKFAYRTLCPYNKIKALNTKSALIEGEKEVEEEMITISVSTASRTNVNYHIRLYRQNYFELEMNQTYNLSKSSKSEVLSPSSPIFYYFNFPKDEDSALIKLDSNDNICMTLSIQEASCPVLDLNRNVKFDGIYQTIDQLGGIYFTRDMVPTKDGVYIVLLVKDNDRSCHELPSQNYTLLSNIDPIIHRRKQVSFSITNNMTKDEYWIATFGALGMFFCAYVVVFIVSLGVCIHSSRTGRQQDQIEDRQPIFEDNEVSAINSSSPNQFHTAIDVHHILSDNPNDVSFEPSPSPTEGTDNIETLNQSEDVIDTENNIEPSNRLVSPLSEDSSLNEEDIDMLQDVDFEKDIFRTKLTLHISDLARKSSRVLSKKSNLYFYNLGTIAIFYGLPVVQLVFTYQQVTNQNGNKDTCYYNFLCAHPLGKISDFNHVFSNLGYVMLGILFMICTRRKQLMIKKQRSAFEQPHSYLAYNSTPRRPRRQPQQQFGIPQHFGMYYSMGLALIMEGIMSGCYHVCPSHVNFQFDTAFMYTIAILILLKIYQTRHPDINANAYTAFGVLAFIIFIGVIGVLYGSNNQYFWIFFTALHVLSCLALSFQVYYMGRFRLNLGIFKRFWLICYNDVRAIYGGHWYGLKPLYPDRMILLLVMNAANWGLSAYGVTSITKENGGDFASFLVAVLIMNVMLYTCFYIAMKLRYGERIHCEPAFYILLSIFTWTGSAYFFFNKSTSWKYSPAESRHYNKECELFHFYGK